MKKNIDMLHGPVLPALTKLALPIMATSLIQMAYNLTDMIWIGRLGSNAVAAVGAAGMYMWLSNGLASLSKMGGQVNTGYSLGSGSRKEAAGYIANTLRFAAISGIIFGIVCMLSATPLIGFFNLNSPQVIADAKIYLQITCGLVVFSFVNQSFTGIFTALGNSKAAFLATTSGLIVNIILDPVLIFGLVTISGYADHGCCCCNRNRTGDRNPDISYICKERYSNFPGSTFLRKTEHALSYFYYKDWPSDFHPEYAVYRHFHDYRKTGCRLWRCGCCCAESWFTD